MEDVDRKKSYMKKKKAFVDHYVLIKDFNKFMSNKIKREHRKHFCMYCLQCFTSEDILNKHKTACIATYGKQTIKMPEKGYSILKFNNSTNNYQHLLPSMQILKQ